MLKKTASLCFVVAVLAGSAVHAEIIDRLLAVVNGQTITQSDVTAANTLQLVPPVPAGSDPLGVTLNRLIERALILTEVDRYQPPEPAAEEIDKRVAEIRERSGGAPALQRQLAALGMTVEQLRRLIRDNLRIITYLNERFGADAAARPEMRDEWIAGLRRRADVKMLYLGK